MKRIVVTASLATVPGALPCWTSMVVSADQARTLREDHQALHDVEADRIERDLHDGRVSLQEEDLRAVPDHQVQHQQHRRLPAETNQPGAQLGRQLHALIGAGKRGPEPAVENEAEHAVDGPRRQQRQRQPQQIPPEDQGQGDGDEVDRRRDDRDLDVRPQVLGRRDRRGRDRIDELRNDGQDRHRRPGAALGVDVGHHDGQADHRDHHRDADLKTQGRPDDRPRYPVFAPAQVFGGELSGGGRDPQRRDRPGHHRDPDDVLVVPQLGRAHDAGDGDRRDQGGAERQQRVEQVPQRVAGDSGRVTHRRFARPSL